MRSSFAWHGRGRINSYDRELAGAPKSSPTSFVLPWDPHQRSYSTATCDPCWSDNIVTEYHINELITELKKSPYYGRRNISKAIWAIVLMMAITVVLFAVLERTLHSRIGGSITWRVVFSVALLVESVAAVWLLCAMSRFNLQRPARLKIVVKEVEARVFAPLKASIIISNLGAYIQIFFLWKVPNHTILYPQPEYTPTRFEPIKIQEMPLPEMIKPGEQKEDEREFHMANTQNLPTTKLALVGDSSPPPVNISPDRPFIIPTRDIQIQYSPESRAQDVQAIGREKHRH